MEKYEQMSSNQPPPQQVLSCDVCAINKPVEVEVFFDSKVNKLCSDICFSAYKFANKLTVGKFLNYKVLFVGLDLYIRNHN